MSPRVVFDTNILFSSVGWRGAPYRCLQAVIEGRASSVICTEILAELRDKLLHKQRMTSADAAESVGAIVAISEMVEISGALRVVPADPKGDMGIECAIAGQAA